MRVDRVKLLQRLEAVAAGLATKEAEAQTTCFAFKGDKVFTYNGEVACRLKCKTGIEGAVAAKPVLSLLGKLPEDEIDISVVEGELFIQGKGRRRAGITMEAEVLLPLENVEEPTEWRSLPDDFSEAAAIVQSCVSDDKDETDLMCIHIAPKFLEACDNYQMTRYPVETGFKKPVLIRGKVIAHITGLGMTKVSQSDNWLHFRNGEGLVLSCRTYATDYPDISQWLDLRGSKVKLPSGLAEALDKAEVFSATRPDDDNRITISIREGQLKVRGQSGAGWYEEHKKLKYTGPAMKFMISPQILLEIISKHHSCEVNDKTLRVNGGRFIYVTRVHKPKD